MASDNTPLERSHEVPSSQSKPYMNIKVSRPVLFGAVSNRPAFELVHSLGTHDELTYGVLLDLPNSVSYIIILRCDSPAVEGPLADLCPSDT